MHQPPWSPPSQRGWSALESTPSRSKHSKLNHTCTTSVEKSHMLCFKMFCKIIQLVIRSMPRHFWGPLRSPLLKMIQDTGGSNNRSQTLKLPDSSHAWELQVFSWCFSISSPLQHLSSNTHRPLLPTGTELTRKCSASP